MIILAFVVSISLLLLSGVYSLFSIREYKAATSWVSHTQQLISDARSVLSYAQDVQNAKRGFLLNNNARYLRPFYSAVKNLGPIEQRVIRLTKDNPSQSSRMKEIQDLIFIETEMARKVAFVGEKESIEKAIVLNRSYDGENNMQMIRAKMTRFIDAEESLLFKRLKTEQQSFYTVVSTITLVVVLAIIILIVTLYFFIKDYNKRFKYERELFENEKRLTIILESMPLAVFIMHTDGTPYYSNSMANEMLAINQTPTENMEEYTSIFQIVHTGTNIPYKSEDFPISRAARGEVILGEELMDFLHSNKRMPIRVNASPIRNSQGEIQYAMCIFEDITEDKKVASELQEAKKQAEQSLILMESFLANMSHEIRTPMNAILGFLDLLRKRPLDSQSADYVDIIRSSSENLLRIINDILDISKMEASMMELEEVPLSLPDLFKSLYVLLVPKAEQKNIELKFNCDEKIPDVLLGDTTRLTQILVNLIGNAIKFTKKGSVTITATLVKLNAETVDLELAIADTGIGIAEDKLNAVFERFQQAESYTTRNYGGTGLGLSIARQLVELQNGHITLESKLNVGTTFRVFIPLKLNIENLSKQKKAEQKFTDFESLKKLNVLVAEDNPINVKLLEIHFKELGVPTTFVENGQELVDKLKDSPYSIVLMDLEMPVMNGYEAIRIIRQEMKIDIPVIAMTAHAMAGEEEKCLGLGVNEFVSKPIEFEKLYRKMIAVTNVGSSSSVQVETIEKEIVVENTSNELFDLSYLKEMTGGNQEFETEMIELFLKQMPEDMVLMQREIEGQNAAAVRKLAHKMKSSVFVVGAKEMIEQLNYFETNPTSDESQLSVNEKDVYLNSFKIMNSQFEQISQALNAYLSN